MNSAAISLVKTVGVIEGVCADDNEIAVPEGLSVYYCYTVTHNGNVTMAEHTLVDNRLGTLFDSLEIDLAPSQSITSVGLGIEASALVDAITVNEATWTALASEEALLATASAAATVTIGIEDYEVTVAGTYIPPTGGGTTGGQMIYDMNVLNTGTAIIKNLQLSFVVTVGTAFNTGDEAWSCPDGSPAGTTCTISIPVLEPGEDVDLVLNLDVIAEIDINQLVLELDSETETATPITGGRTIVVIGPDALQRLFMYMPALERTAEVGE